MHKVIEVQPLDGFKLALTFDDGTKGVVDLSDLAGRGVFSLWLEAGVFQNVRIGSSGELAWGDEVDLCPDSLYLRVTGKSVDEVLSAVASSPAHA
ncbi:MAG: DUF2442 domain-containing protein [Candidatus Hydrogenedentes bacterium]|nr:DUF2442 domain-containing protein [Candidatus Hydrogenedentota bacterium]